MYHCTVNVGPINIIVVLYFINSYYLTSFSFFCLTFLLRAVSAKAYKCCNVFLPGSHQNISNYQNMMLSSFWLYPDMLQEVGVNMTTDDLPTYLSHHKLLSCPQVRELFSYQGSSAWFQLSWRESFFWRCQLAHTGVFVYESDWSHDTFFSY